MTITIKCECGNKMELTAPPKKYLQLRDNLETRKFRYDGAEDREFRIYCDQCGNWITLGID
jgi:hypothetical protein